MQVQQQQELANNPNSPHNNSNDQLQVQPINTNTPQKKMKKWKIIGLIIIIGLIGVINYNTYINLEAKHQKRIQNEQRNQTVQQKESSNVDNNIMNEQPDNIDNGVTEQHAQQIIGNQYSQQLNWVANRISLGKPNIKNTHLNLYVIKSMDKQSTLCGIINGLGIITNRTIQNIYNLMRNGNITKILLYTNEKYSNQQLKQKLYQIEIKQKNINFIEENNRYQINNWSQIAYFREKVDADYTFFTNHITNCTAVSYFQSHFQLNETQSHLMSQQMLRNKQLGLSYTQKCNQQHNEPKQLLSLIQTDLNSLSMEKINEYIFIFDPRLTQIITPINFAYYSKYTLQEIIILPLLTILQKSEHIHPFQNKYQPIHSCGIGLSSAYLQYPIINPQKQKKKTICIVSYPSNPYTINKQQFKQYLNSLSALEVKNISSSVVVYLPYVSSSPQSLFYYAGALIELKLNEKIKPDRVKLRIIGNKTLPSYAVYDSVYSYCPNQALIVSSRHNIMFKKNFTQKIIQSLTQKSHYYFTNYIYTHTDKITMFQKLPIYDKQYKMRQNPSLFRSYFQPLQIFKSDLMKSTLFWVLKSAELQFYETEAAFVTYMMECIRLKFKYINETLFQVQGRNETQIERKQIENIRRYAEFTRLKGGRLSPYQFNCLENQAYRRNAPEKIVRKVHQIWIGANKISNIRLKLHQTIKKNNPTYEVLLWKDENLTKQNFPLTEHLVKRTLQYQENSQRNYNALIADLLRYEILYHHGGIYIDFKMQVLKPLDAFLKYEIFFIDGGSDETRFPTPSSVGVGIIGSIQNSYYFGLILKQMISQSKLNYNDLFIPGITGGLVIRKAFNDQELFHIVGFGQHLFIPRPSFDGINDCGKVKHFSLDQQVFEIADMKSKNVYKVGIPCKQYPQAYIISYKPLASTWKVDKKSMN